MIEINRPVQLANGTAVLVVDEIGTDSSHEDPVLVAPENSVRQRVWVRESTISDINEKYPKAHIHGVWQTLLHSKLIKPAERPDALYLIKALEIALYVEGGVAMRSGYAAANTLTFPSPISLAEAIAIDVDLLKLRIPPEQATHPVETAKRRAKATERLRLTAIALTTPVLIVAYIVDSGLAARSTSRQAFLDDLTQQSQTLAADIEVTKGKKRQPTPEAQKASLERVWRIAQATEGLTIENGNANESTWTARAVTVDETALPPGVKVVSLQTGGFELRWGI